jgi:hypothetical protein
MTHFSTCLLFFYPIGLRRKRFGLRYVAKVMNLEEASSALRLTYSNRHLNVESRLNPLDPLTGLPAASKVTPESPP